jgi:hypothetical protein
MSNSALPRNWPLVSMALIRTEYTPAGIGDVAVTRLETLLLAETVKKQVDGFVTAKLHGIAFPPASYALRTPISDPLAALPAIVVLLILIAIQSAPMVY